MSDKTGIEWTDRTWNPTTGCDRVSPGCDHCYAMTMAKRLKGMGSEKYQRDGDPRTSGPGFGVSVHPDTLTEPLRWRKPQRVFVNSMSDLFHDQVPDEYIAKVFAVMALAPQHTFQVLTKRHARMRSLLASNAFLTDVCEHGHRLARDGAKRLDDRIFDHGPYPLPNVWLGVSTENQQWADIRIPALLNTPAAVRFISAEPLLGGIKLAAEWLPVACGNCNCEMGCNPPSGGLDWVIVGGESGRGARPMHPRWARDIRDQCQSAGVPFLFKQRGEWTWNEGDDDFRVPSKPFTDHVAVMHAAGMTAMTQGNAFNPFERGHPFWATRIERVGKHRAGRLLDGRTGDEFPQAVTS